MTVSVEQLARRWTLSERVIRRGIAAGKVPALRIGREYRVLKRWVDSQEWECLKASGQLAEILADSDQ